MNDPGPQPSRSRLSLLIETGLWLALPSLFLMSYLVQYDAPKEAALLHLVVLGVILGALYLARIGACIVSTPARVYRPALALVSTALIASMAVYYALVLIGLNAWNRVISWSLVSSYVPRSPDLFETLGLNIWVVAVVGSLGVLILSFLVHHLYRRFDWAPGLSSEIRPRLMIVLVLGYFSISYLAYSQFSQQLWSYKGEPLSLSTFPPQWKLRNHSIDGVHLARMQKLEQAARAAYQPIERTPPTNVVMIVVDALRADHMGIYGYHRNTTPYLSSLQEEGKLAKAESMHAVCAESMCGLMAMGSSRYLHQVAPDPLDLHEVLKMHGYGLHMILGGDHTNFYDMKELYSQADSYFDGLASDKYYFNNDQLVLDRIQGLEAAGPEPVMLQLHLMSAHTLGTRFMSQPFQPARNYSRPDRQMQTDLERNPQPFVNYYDNGVLQTDQVIKQSIAHLRESGFLDNALVVVVGDHGEALGEHGLISHARGVYEPVLRIPFVLIRFSQGQSARISTERPEVRYASQVDIAPTLLHELDLPIPGHWSGVPLQKRDVSRVIYFQQGTEAGLLDTRNRPTPLKFWIDRRTGERFAFDLQSDPGEQVNIADELSPGQLQDYTELLHSALRVISSDGGRPDWR